MPIGRARAGLPIGVQIMGQLLDDRTTLAFAVLVVREFGGFVPRRRPPEPRRRSQGVTGAEPRS